MEKSISCSPPERMHAAEGLPLGWGGAWRACAQGATVKIPPDMNTQEHLLDILDDVLSLEGRAKTFTPDTALLGALPELDSMAVVSLITALEEQFGIVVDDDEIDGSTFATVGALTDFLNGKLAA